MGVIPQVRFVKQPSSRFVNWAVFLLRRSYLWTLKIRGIIQPKDPMTRTGPVPPDLLGPESP